ncbi:MAG: flagellar assembly protein FliX [Parvibaculaceae bacterium]
MKIGASRQIGSTSAKRGTSARSAGSGFAVNSAEEGRGLAGLSASSSLTAVDSLLALQETGGLEDATSSPRRAVARGKQMLDILDDIKLSILSGQVPEAKLTRLLHVVEGQQAQVRDPALADILGHIELRARVELAKFGNFPKD